MYPSASGLMKGAYVLWESTRKHSLPDVIIIGTGSEVHVALEAGRLLDSRGIRARVVSMPSWELFEAQSKDYREAILPPSVRSRVAVEAGTVKGWERYVGLDGGVVGMKGYGASAPGDVCFREFGFTPERVARVAMQVVRRAT
jgi:transketolase